MLPRRPKREAAKASVLFMLAVCLYPGIDFTTGRHSASALQKQSFRTVACPATQSVSSSLATSDHLYAPKQRDAHYGNPMNVAQYLVDLHDSRAAFDFCGGMMFQLALSEKLRSHLAQVAKGDGLQPVVFDKSMMRMAQIPDYSQTANADNVQIFHGREIRQVPDAAGGMGFVLQLALAEEDPEGWTQAEVESYNGWEHDSRRKWRNGEILESEGFKTFKSKFGDEAFTLHHRFYLHFDGRDAMWLSAEDGCEGEPSQGAFQSLFAGMFR
eukprot:TRINITY_DN50282_c0_g1_i1.p1 TRINITY_DN50282_c0_g1~~TRINITY_DN50282_c0_g1_i1.p1  ORF type:complete len:270 (+),score=32.38 TRINITY_DN50282_c0_g1_i1:77-886(+)